MAPRTNVPADHLPARSHPLALVSALQSCTERLRRLAHISPCPYHYVLASTHGRFGGDCFSKIPPSDQTSLNLTPKAPGESDHDF